MWFDFNILTKKSHCIVLAVTLACYFAKLLKIETNGNPVQSIKNLIEKIYDNNKYAEVINKGPIDPNETNKNMQMQNVSSSVVLMMKLVSYYEDKFKIANHEPTEKGTTVGAQNNKLNIHNKAVQRIGFKSKDIYENDMLTPGVVIA